MNKKPSALSVLAKMADLDLKEFVFAFPLNTNFKYARTGREGWGEVTIAVTNHIIANIDKFSGSLYMADKDAYADIEKTLEQEGAAFDEMKVRAEKAEAQVAALQTALAAANEDAAYLARAAENLMRKWGSDNIVLYDFAEISAVIEHYRARVGAS